jgi:hypothetical protein
MLIAGILAIVSITPVVFSSQSQVTSTTTESKESLFYTTVTTVGDSTVAEVLVNTTLQIRPASATSHSSALDYGPLAMLAFLLLSVVILFGYRSSDRA